MSIEVLSADTCRQLLGEVPVGWLAHCTDQGVHMVPVNFSLHAEEIILRASYGETLDAAVHGRTMTFAVSEFDAETRTGWSVTVRGTAHLLGDDLVNPGLPTVEPWAEPERTVPIGLPLTTISGRRVWPEESDEDTEPPRPTPVPRP